MTTVGGWLAAHGDLERRDREVLLGRATGLTRAQILARPERCLTAGALPTLHDWAERRRCGEPVAYIVGEKEFWGLTLEVSPAVLVPRPETELLVETALEELCTPGAHVGAISRSRPGAERVAHRSYLDHGSRSGDRSYRVTRVLELGTGSGAVAIALAREAAGRGLPVDVTATDVSPDALSLAERNARRHDVEIHWLRSDWFSSVNGAFHVVISNPPYVADNDPHLKALGHEPRLALAAGPDGLDAIRRITAAASHHLEPGGMLALEHGHDQGPQVRALMQNAGLVSAQTLPDLAGLDRITRGFLPERAS